MPAPLTILQTFLVSWSVLAGWTHSLNIPRAADCPGYKASNVVRSDSGVTADLTLAGTECNIFGKDLHDLKFEVAYQTGEL